jgi:hypothetical protein
MKHKGKQAECEACKLGLQREATQAFPMPNAEQRVARLHRAALNRAGRDDAMRSLGLVKVRGSLGGVYWE